MKKIVIFDMDGTLIDSSVDITSSVNHVRSTLDLAPLSIDYVVEAINAPERNLSKLFYGKEHYEEPLRTLFEAHYFDECIKNVVLYEGIKDLLEALRTKDILCSVATNAPQLYAKRMLSHLKVDHYFDCIFGACTYAAKPHPEMLQAILEHYKYDAKTHSSPIMVGDNQKDIQAALNASISGCHVSWGFARIYTEDSIRSPRELLDIIDIL